MNQEERKEKRDRFNGWRFAHRGLHAAPEAPENSLAAFRRAVESGYGAELDVHLLSDGTLAVFHDSDLQRMTGQKGILENCTREDLSGLFLGGTQETIPLFQEVLDVFQGRAPLIIELKTWEGNADRLAEAVCRVLDGYEGLYCLESFDPYAILWLRRHRPDEIRGMLSMDYLKSKNDLTFIRAFMATHLLHVFLTRPDFIAYRFKDRKRFGNRFCLKVLKKQGVSWTIRTPGQLKAAEKEGLWPIFEKFQP